MRKLRATILGGIAAAALCGAAVAQADTYTIYVTPSTGWVPTYPAYVTEQIHVVEPYVYERGYAPRAYPADPYYSSRRAYMEEAGRQWDAIVYNSRPPTPYEADRFYGDPYANTYPNFGFPFTSLNPGSLASSRDSNPSDFATGIYNPKP